MGQHFGMHTPLERGGSVVGAVSAGLEEGKERGRKASREKRAVAGEERQVAGEERNVAREGREVVTADQATEKHAFGAIKAKHDFGIQKEQDVRENDMNKVRYEGFLAAAKMTKLKQPAEIGNMAIDMIRDFGGLAAGDMLMAWADRMGQTPSGIAGGTIPGEDEGKPGYFVTDQAGDKLQINGEDWFVQAEKYVIEDKNMVRNTQTGELSRFSDEWGWQMVGKDTAANSMDMEAMRIKKGSTAYELAIDKTIGTEMADWFMKGKTLSISKIREGRGLIFAVTGKRYNEETGKWDMVEGAQTMDEGWQLTRTLMDMTEEEWIDRILNPGLTSVKQRAHKLAQDTLKPTLGGQFAAAEATMLFNRIWNDGAPLKENAARLIMFLDQMAEMGRTKDGIAEYMRINRTFRNYKGPTLATSHLDFQFGELEWNEKYLPGQEMAEKRAQADVGKYVETKTIGGRKVGKLADGTLEWID